MPKDLRKLCSFCLRDNSPWRFPQEPCHYCGKSEDWRTASGIVEHPFRLPPRFLLQQRYVLGRQLGAGGFGITYLGFDLKTEKFVAVKECFYSAKSMRHRDTGQVIPKPGAENIFANLRRQLEKEAAILKGIHHPAIVQGLDSFQANNTSYYVMEYLSGRSLEKIVRESHPTGMPEKELAGYMRPILDGVKRIHGKPGDPTVLLHRDIKPNNIICTSGGQATLVDFGASREVILAGEGRDQEYSITYTEHFSPIEQYFPNRLEDPFQTGLGPCSDIYALAVTMYTCLAGLTPEGSFVYPTRSQERYALVSQGKPDPLTPIADLARHPVSAQFADGIMQGLHLKPGDRPQCIDDFLEVLGMATIPEPEMAPFLLKIEFGEHQGHEIPLTRQSPLRIGRDPHYCNLVCTDQDSLTMSGQHVELFMRDGSLYITDLNSRNGTMVNGKALLPREEARLAVGDSVTLASAMAFTIQAQPAPVPTGPPDYPRIIAKLPETLGNAPGSGGQETSLPPAMPVSAISTTHTITRIKPPGITQPPVVVAPIPNTRPFQLELADRWRRFGNLLIDAIVAGMTGSILASFNDISPPMDLGFIILVEVIYYLLMERLFGKTIGKWVTNTKVLTTEGLKPSTGQLVGRTLTRFIPIIDPLSYLFDPVGLHDRWSNTRVYVDIDTRGHVRNNPTA